MSKLSQISLRITQPLVDVKKNIALKKRDDFVVNLPLQSKFHSKWKVVPIWRSLLQSKIWIQIWIENLKKVQKSIIKLLEDFVHQKRRIY